MDYRILMILLALSSARPSFADIEKELRKGGEDPLNRHEKQVLRQLKKLENKDIGRRVLADGSVEYLFGYGIPTIPCKFLDSCEIIFEEGEVILKEKDAIGNTDNRIIVTPMVKEYGENARSLIVVTPMINGVESNIHIRTNRRNYKIKVKTTKRSS